MDLLRMGFGVAAGVLVLGLSCGPAAAGCTESSEARAVAKSVGKAMRCDYRVLRSGPNPNCVPAAPPPCAGSLVGDANDLAYGSGPLAEVDKRELRDQLRCQRRIGKAVDYYVRRKLRFLVRGKVPAEAEAKALKHMDKLAKDCAVTVAQDAGTQLVLPTVGPQCAAAVGPVGSAVDTTGLRDCLRQLAEVWVDRWGPDPQPLRPNIVFILTDDQRWDTTDATHSPFGTDIMPLLRSELGGSGVEFTDAFMTTPICCPSRASILAGQYAHNTGIQSNKPPQGGAEEFDDSSTIGTRLQAAGYRTGFYGKYMNGYRNLWDPILGEPPYVPPGWSEWHVFQNVRFFDYELIRNGVGFDHVSQDFGSAEEDYSTDLLRKLAVEFIDSSVALGDPFFLYLNFKAPHLPTTPAPRHVGMFDGLAPWRPESFNEPDISDKATWWRNRPPLDAAEIAELDLIRQRQLEMLQAVDEAIGGPELFGAKSIMQTLRDNGIVDDTLVLYFSDNGWLWGEHRRIKKNCPFEECIRSPMFVRYPRLAPLPRAESRFALNIDFAPTLAELAGASGAGAAWDGLTLVRVLDGTAPSWRSDFETEAYPNNRVYAQVREARWKYTETLLDPNTNEVEAELYDLLNDPLELESLANDPNQAARAAAMAARLREFRPGWPGDTEGLDVDEDE